MEESPTGTDSELSISAGCSQLETGVGDVHMVSAPVTKEIESRGDGRVSFGKAKRETMNHMWH